MRCKKIEFVINECDRKEDQIVQKYCIRKEEGVRDRRREIERESESARKKKSKGERKEYRKKERKKKKKKINKQINWNKQSK